MAYINGNKPIITNGLVYALDFGNSKSFTSGSNFANNMVYSSPSVTASVSTATVNTNKILNTITNWRTTCTFSYTLERSGSLTYQGGVSTYGRGKGFTLTQQDGPYDAGLRTYNSFLNNNTGVIHVTWVFAESTVVYYVNGIPQPTLPLYTSLAASGDSFSFATDGYKFKNFYVYNRALTWDEIYYNFTLTAKQYNIPVQTKPNYVNESTYLFVTASNITDSQIISSLETFTTALKSSSLWNKIDAIYPFVGAVSSSQKLNLKQPTYYDIVTDYSNALYASSNLDKNIRYSGSFTLSLSGSKPNNNTSFLNPNYSLGNQGSYNYTHQSADNQHIAYLSYDQPQSSSFLMGVENVGTSSIVLYQTEDAISSSMYTLVRGGITSSGVVGFVMGSRTGSSTFQIYKNTQSGSINANSTASINYTTYFNSSNSNNTASGIAPYNISYISVGDGLTPSQYTTYYNLVSQLQTNLKRQNTLLDNYTGAAAAYSLRRIGPSGYFGPAIRVRRDSDNTLRDIGFTSDGQLDTVGLLDFVGVTGSGFVDTWYDQSGISRDATQTITSNQPQVVNSGSILIQNGKPTILFDGINDSLVNTTPFLYTNFSGFFVNKFNQFNISNGASVIIQYSKLDLAQLGTTNFQSSDTGIATITSYPLVDVGTGSLRLHTHLTAISGSTTTSTLFLNSTQKASGSRILTSTKTTLAIGNTDDSSLPANINQQEIILYPSTQSTNRILIESNINSYYKIYGSATASFDTDYQSFITATGITQPTQSAALETLVSDLKSYGLWSKMKAIYPMVTDKNNRFAYSQALGTTWNATNVYVTQSFITAPDGTSTGNFVSESAVTDTHYLYQTISDGLVTGSEYVASIYGKFLNRPWIAVETNAGAKAWFNIQTGVTGSLTGSNATITSVGSGWYRCALYFTSSVASGPQNIEYHLADIDGNLSYAGVLGTGSYLWGAQFENGNLVGPYRATTTVGFTTGSMLDQMKYNLKNTGSFSGSYVGGWNPGYSGNKPNGSTGYMDTFINPVTTLSTASAHFYLTLRTSIIENATEIGNNDSAFIVGGFSTSGLLDMPTTTDRISLGISPTSNNKGNYLVMLNSNSRKVLRNQINVGQAGPATTNFDSSTIKIATGKFAISSKENAFATIGDGLTDYESKALYWIVQKYQTTLGRQVY